MVSAGSLYYAREAANRPLYSTDCLILKDQIRLSDETIDALTDDEARQIADLNHLYREHCLDD